jgi:ankyrin repeat protein
MKNIGTTSPLKVGLGKIGLYPPKSVYSAMRFCLCNPGKEEELKAILKKYPDAVRWEKESDMQPLAYAIWQKQFGSAEALIKCDPTILKDGQHNGNTVLHRAVSEGNAGLFKFLKDLGADTLQTDAAGNTLLHTVARSRFHPEIIPLLRADGVDPTARNDKGETPLMLTAGNGGGKMLEEFFKLDPDISQRDGEGETMLMKAAGTRDGDSATIRRLAALGADIDAKSNDGSTAVNIALGRYNVDSAIELIDLGAKVDFDSRALHSCMAMCAEYDDTSLKTLIAEKKEDAVHEERERQVRDRLKLQQRIAAEKKQHAENTVAACIEGTHTAVTVKKPLQLKVKSP